MTTKIPRKVSFLKPVLPLVPEEATKTEEDKSKFVTMELKSQARTSSGGTYKKHIVLSMRELPNKGLMPRGILLKSENRTITSNLMIGWPSFKPCSEERLLLPLMHPLKNKNKIQLAP